MNNRLIDIICLLKSERRYVSFCFQKYKIAALRRICYHETSLEYNKLSITQGSDDFKIHFKEFMSISAYLNLYI